MLLSNVCVTKAELTGFVKAFLSRGESPSPGDQSRCSVSPQRKTESLTTVACPHTACYHTTQWSRKICYFCQPSLFPSSKLVTNTFQIFCPSQRISNVIQAKQITDFVNTFWMEEILLKSFKNRYSALWITSHLLSLSYADQIHQMPPSYPELASMNQPVNMSEHLDINLLW